MEPLCLLSAALVVVLVQVQMRKVASHRYTQNPKDLSQSKT